MERKYKRYQYADVPIPRTTAYRRRLKMQLHATQKEESYNEELSKEPEDEQYEAENSVNSEDMFVGNDYSHGQKVITNQLDREQPINLESSESSNYVEDSPCDENIYIDASREVGCHQVADKNAAPSYVSHTQEHFESSEDEPDISPPEILRTTSNSSVDDDACNAQQHSLEEKNTLQTPLLPDTLCKCTDTTVGDVLVMCLALGFRHNLSWEALIDNLRLINNLYRDPVIPASKYFFLQHMEKGHKSTVYHLYCPMCEAYLGKNSDLSDNVIRCECGQDIKVSRAETFFLSVDLKEQLKELFEKSEISKALNYRFERVKANDDAIEDIYDGDIYKSLSAPGEILSSPLNFSYTFNTDGIPFGKSSKKTIWPIYITINELPPKDRAKHMLLAGIWVGNKDPNMTIFLKPFVDGANVLSTEGLTWTRDGQEVQSKVIPLCAVVDSVARCRMLNMKQFNSHYGCTICYQKTERTERGRRFTTPETAVPCRTHDGTVDDMIEAYNLKDEKNQDKRDVRGVKGPSPLMAMLYFNLILGMIPDYMHAILLGVIKHHTELLLTSVGKKYYIGLEHIIAVINERLSKIQPPRSITRTPRSLNERTLWRASEWRSWLIFYCIPCLDGVLKPKYLKHLGMLSTAVNMMLKKSVTRHEINMAHTLLLQYVSLFEKYFGATAMVYNVHLLTHVAPTVMNWGPLWTHNCFSFEGQNRHLLQLTKSPAHVAKQVVRKFLTFNSLPILCEMYTSNDATLDFCESLCGKSFKFLIRCNSGVVLPGRGAPNIFGIDEQNCIEELGWNPLEVISFNRMISGHIRYSTSAYAAMKKTNDSIVCVRERVFGKIEAIVVKSSDKRQVIVLIRKIIVENINFCDHLKKIFAEGELIAVTPSDINSQCVIMRLGTSEYLSQVPYGCYGD